MRRRSKPTLFDLAAALPWQVSLVVGAVLFATLMWVAPVLAERIESPISRTMFTAIADNALPVFAWLLLAVFSIGALVSFFERRKRSHLFTTRTDLAAIRELDWRQFEMLIGEAFRQQGYRVTESGLGGPDGGVDLVLHRDGKKTLVQCKHWRNRQIPVATVREMFGLLQHHGADSVCIICTGTFSTDARRFAVGKPIDLVGDDRLFDLLQKERGRSVPLASADPTPKPPSPAAVGPPPCGACGSKTVVRKNRSTGSEFLGCSQYPRCRFTAEIR